MRWSLEVARRVRWSLEVHKFKDLRSRLEMFLTGSIVWLRLPVCLYSETCQPLFPLLGVL